MNNPRVRVRGFQVPKQGESAASCQDAWLASGQCPGSAASAVHRLAVADGATTASGSGLWAQILVHASVAGIAPWSRSSYRARKLLALRNLWAGRVRTSLPQPLPWFAEEALARGAFSTLLRVQIRQGRWTAEAWGDTCLFQFRDGAVTAMVPDLKPEDFSLAPFLLASVAGHDRDLQARLVQAEGNLQTGDLLLLASDALSCWIRSQEDPQEALEGISKLTDQTDFERWIGKLRSLHHLKNDDTTLVLAEVL